MDHEGSYASLFEKQKNKSTSDEKKFKSLRYDNLTLLALAERMHEVENFPSHLGAGYTYLGQFIDHDITLTPNSDRLAQPSDALNTQNQVSPQLDLSSVYVKGDMNEQPAVDMETGKMLLDNAIGAPLANRNLGKDRDLPRNASTKEALIPDARNDENLMVAQLHVQFLRLHNHIIDKLNNEETTRWSGELFKIAQKEVIAIYQKIVVEDFLFNILNSNVYALYFSK